MNKGKKWITEYQIRDLVRIVVSKIDRFSTDCSTFSCKIIKKIEDKYQIRSKFEIIGVSYFAGELKLLEIIAFSKLDEIPSNKISIREAAHLQSIRLVSEGLCNYKSECNNNKCHCKKMGEKCNSRCHSGHLCQNKNQI